MMHRQSQDHPVAACSISSVLRSALKLVLVAFLAAVASAATENLVRTPVNPADRTALTGHHPAWASVQNDEGAVPADLRLEQLTIILARSPQREQAYTKFLEDQQKPASPDYHRWLTPVELGKRFGTSWHDIHAVTDWLQSQNLHVDAVSNSRDRITFSGPASAVANAFGAEMHYFTVEGEKRISITAEPQIPVALKEVVKAISGLYTVKTYPQHQMNVTQPSQHNVAGSGTEPSSPEATYSCHGTPCFFVFPADFATIYSANTPGIDGTGQTIAIIGRSRVYDTDIQNFEAASGLTVKSSPETVIVPPGGIDPGAPATNGNASGDQGEATLDVTRSSSVAPGATIDLVISGDSMTVDGIGVSATYVVDTNPVPAQIMSISFGACEANAGASQVQLWDSLFKQAAGEGISVFVSSGDSSAAGCDKSFSPPPATQIASPNYICSSSYDTCVGGTEFADFTNPSQYWSPTNNPVNNGSALSYIPEGAWNEPMNSGGNFQVAGTGGGFSSVIATPTYQLGVTGVPGTQGRYSPDVAFSASGHDGYFACLAANNQCSAAGNFVVFAGTSAAAPDMAGITALLNQKAGGAQGLLNPTLYALAATPSNGVFNDVTVASSGVTSCAVTTPSMCNNSTASTNSLTGGLSGYLVNVGYDEATGLGSINVANLLAHWPNGTLTATTTTLAVSSATVAAGTSVTLTATISPAPPNGETVTFIDSTSHTTLGTKTTASGQAIFTSSSIPGGSYMVVANYPGDTSFASSLSTAQSLAVQDFTIGPATLNVTVSSPGQSGTGTITFGLLGGLSAPSFACSGLPSESTCTFVSASATSETITIGTTAASWVHDPLGRGTRIFYALLLPGLMGLVFVPGSRKRKLRTVLGLIALLAVLTLGLPACSSSSTPHNPGTPVGSYPTVQVQATSSTITHTITVNLNVQ